MDENKHRLTESDNEELKKKLDNIIKRSRAEHRILKKLLNELNKKEENKERK